MTIHNFRTDYGSRIDITNQKVTIVEPDRFGAFNNIEPGHTVELSMNDIHVLVYIISNKFGVDISKDNFRSQF